jgi:hypothetical protein
MDFIEWLFKEIVISRFFQTQFFYIFMFLFSISVVVIAWKRRLLRFSLLLWSCAFIIGLTWEIVLFSLGKRHYHFWPPCEIIYHALTEGGPGLIVMVLFADKAGIINCEQYKEEEQKRES